jgi:hypothetical protein
VAEQLSFRLPDGRAFALSADIASELSDRLWPMLITPSALSLAAAIEYALRKDGDGGSIDLDTRQLELVARILKELGYIPSNIRF